MGSLFDWSVYEIIFVILDDILFLITAKTRVHYGKGGIINKMFWHESTGYFKILSPACVFLMCRLNDDERWRVLSMIIN